LLQLLGLPASSSAVLESSSADDALRWVTVSTCDMAWLICVTRRIVRWKRRHILHQVGSLLDGRNQVGKQLAGSFCYADALPRQSAISWAASWLRSANFRTSTATTANPRPWSLREPLRWRALSAKKVGLVSDFFDYRSLGRDLLHGFDGLLTALPLSSAARAPLVAACSTCRLLSAFWLMDAFICSRLELISSTDAACSLVPCERPARRRRPVAPRKLLLPILRGRL